MKWLQLIIVLSNIFCENTIKKREEVIFILVGIFVGFVFNKPFLFISLFYHEMGTVLLLILANFSYLFL